jgi:hypothetical protein
MIPQPLEHASCADDADTSHTMKCNFSANITVGKHLISNAFLDFHWAFRPLVASVLGLDGQLWTSISFTFFLVARNPLSPATRS